MSPVPSFPLPVVYTFRQGIPVLPATDPPCDFTSAHEAEHSFRTPFRGLDNFRYTLRKTTDDCPRQWGANHVQRLSDEPVPRLVGTGYHDRESAPQGDAKATIRVIFRYADLRIPM